MPLLKPAEFGKRAKDGALLEKPYPVYLFYGQDEFALHSAAETLKNEFLKTHNAAESFFRIPFLEVKEKKQAEEDEGLGAGREVPVDELLAQLNTSSMFGGRKMFWLGPVRSTPKSVLGPLDSYVNSFNPDSILVTTILKEKKGELDTLEKTQFFKSCMEHGAVVRFGDMTARGLASAISLKLGQLGVKASGEAAEKIAAYYGQDRGRLEAELEKIAAYMGYEGRLEARDVEEVSPDLREYAMWDFTDSFILKDIRKSQAALAGLLDSGAHPQAILKALLTSLLWSAAAADVRSKGGTLAEFQDLMGTKSYQATSAWNKSLKLDDDFVRRSLNRMLKAHMAMMAGGAPGEAALAMMTLGALTETTQGASGRVLSRK